MSDIKDPNVGTGKLFKIVDNEEKDADIREAIVKGVYDAFEKNGDEMSGENMSYTIYVLSKLLLSTEGDSTLLKQAITAALEQEGYNL